MLEVILVYFFAKSIGNIAEQKGLSTKNWIFRTVLLCIVAYVFGICLALLIWGTNNLIMLELTALGFIIAGYFTLRDNLLKRDDYNPKNNRDKD